MSVVAVYNMKGGVGKTTAAVNLSYLAAAAGQRTLLWDLDPQAASSFAFRVRPRVAGFGRKSLESGEALAAAIKETDYDNLDLLPADFAYRKVDRLLGRYDRPERVVTALLDTIGRDYDAVFLDCPAGFSLLTAGVFAAADAVLVPTIPTVLSLRMVARLIKWADRSGSRSELAAFFSMVDRRKALHRRASEWAAACPEVFLAGHVPYASIVEQMTVRRMPLHAFAAADPAAAAFAGIRAELQARLERRGRGSARQREKWPRLLQAVESLVVRLERGDPDAVAPPMRGSSADDVTFVHSFDTGQRDLQRCGYVLELRERPGSFLVVAARSDSAADNAQVTGRAQAQIDRRWAIQILSGAMSPLTALERRLGPPVPRVIEIVRALVGRSLLRVDSRATGRPGAAHEPADDGDREHGRSRKLPNPTTV